MKASEINEDVTQQQETAGPDGQAAEFATDNAAADNATAENVAAAGDVAAPPADDLEGVQKALAQSEHQRKRQAAEFQNFKRRTETEKQQAVGLGKSIVLQRLLDVFDDLNRSVNAAVEAPVNSEEETRKSFSSLKSGLDLAYQKLMDELGKLDVKVIETVGNPFDEEFHEAVMQQPAPESQEPGTILTEVQRGFTLGDRVLRHAKVIVAS